MAPGKCILSTIPGPGYAYMSGTSMAAPTVTGAVALYKSSRPNATPAEVREALRYLGNLNWKTSTDPDSTHEPLLDVSKIGSLGTFALSPGSSTVATVEAGTTGTVPIMVARSSTFFERVEPVGHLTSIGLDRSAGPDQRHGLDRDRGWRVSDRSEGHAHRDLSDDRPGHEPGSDRQHERLGQRRRGPAHRPGPVSLVHPDHPDGDDQHAGPDLVAGGHRPVQCDRRLRSRHQATNGGAWSPSIALARPSETTTFTLGFATSYRFRVRAVDAAGNWSPWVMGAVDPWLTPVDDRSAQIARGGPWSGISRASAYRSTLLGSTKLGASLSFTFTGHAIALVGPRSLSHGRAQVYVDGVYIQTINMRTTSLDQPRRRLHASVPGWRQTQDQARRGRKGPCEALPA